jgi:uncharacterized protein (DUF362 family)
MARKISRRSFIKESTAIGVGSLVGAGVIIGFSTGGGNLLYAGEKIDISVVEGEDYFKNTITAVKQLGGMKHFVSKNSKVAILANPQKNNPGAYTRPDIVAAAIRMCKEAGAKEVACISWQPLENWENTGLKKTVDAEGAKLVIIDRSDESLFKPVPVPKGKLLKEARVMNEFFNYDLLIDIPITKDHAGNKFTGTLKNLMGLNSPLNNRTFHKPNWKTDINDIRHLDQSIADLNTVITPALCIIDATEFIINNGPFGPGKLHKPNQVVAGVDRVAIDAYCSTLWGLEPKNIITIAQAHEHQLGEINLEKVKIKKISS